MSRTPAILTTNFHDREAVARQAAREWNADLASIEHVASGASFTYRFTAHGEQRYLRLMPPHWRTRPEIEGELAYIDHLDSNGINLARPVPSSHGERIAEIDSSIGACFALAFEAIDGNASIDVNWSPEQAHATGRLMAQMHVAARGFTLPPGTTRPSWRDELRMLDNQLPHDETELRAIVTETAALFERLPRTDDAYGVVHFDLSGDNLIWHGPEPTAIDFDDCMWHWHVSDIARTIGYFRENERGRIGPRETAFLRGYREIRELTPLWLDVLLEFLRLALIGELAWTAYGGVEDSGAATHAEQVANLRRAIREYRTGHAPS